MDAHAVTSSETKGSLLLWYGVLAGPLAWTAQIVIAPDLAEILCYPGATASGRGDVFGISVDTFLIGVNSLMTLIALSGLVASWLCWSRHRREDATPARRAAWMALAGVLVSSLFLVAIVVGYIPLFMLEPCAVAP